MNQLLVILFFNFVFLNFFLSDAQAETMLSLGQGQRYENNSSGQGTSEQKYISVQVGLIQPTQWVYLGEFNYFSTDSGSGSISIQRSHTEAILWLQKQFMGPTFVPFLEGGLGLYSESINTKVYSASTTSQGKLDYLFGLSAGFWWWFFRDQVGASFDLRYISFNNLSPNPMMDFLWLRLGYKF